MARTPGYDENGRRKGTWTREEDQRLSDFITKHGCKNWRIVPILAGLSRCGKSCRLRWLNYLKSGIRRGNFSKDEEETIIRLHGSLGNRWSAIAAQLPGRTDHEVKNYWHTYLKKQPFLPKKTSSVYYQDTNEIKEELPISHNYEPSNAPAAISAEGFDVVPPLLSSSSETSTLSEPAASFSTIDDGSTVSCPEFDVSSTGTYCASPGGFWTEPFLTDTYFDSIFPTGSFSMSLYDEDYR